MRAYICANPGCRRRRRRITTVPAGDAGQRGRDKSDSPGRRERSARRGASGTADPRLGLLIAVSSAVVFYGTIAACIWHFL